MKFYPVQRGSRMWYPWSNLEEGDFFFVGNITDSHASQIRSSGVKWLRDHDKEEFTIHQHKDEAGFTFILARKSMSSTEDGDPPPFKSNIVTKPEMYRQSCLREVRRTLDVYEAGGLGSAQAIDWILQVLKSRSGT